MRCRMNVWQISVDSSQPRRRKNAVHSYYQEVYREGRPVSVLGKSRKRTGAIEPGWTNMVR
jgi:hypothetical protein